ncbi:hypothetical protein EIP86_002498 [Pleurotus ostreatoroseus]|nr:hypothetical protein EIP86_002498 [Pleurotus ostreatoroseus]
MSADLMPAPVQQFKGEIMDFDLGIEIDHRKRRRNRTTQSCLNCHTSKRKVCPCPHRAARPPLTSPTVRPQTPVSALHPARPHRAVCLRGRRPRVEVRRVSCPCIDPCVLMCCNDRDDPNIDETTRLRNRIAELESLVRELRGTSPPPSALGPSHTHTPSLPRAGKPHPRWAEPNYCDGDAAEKWHSRASRRTQLQLQRARQLESSASSPSSSSSSNNGNGANANGSPVVKTEGEGAAGAGAGQLYRLSPSPGPTLALDGMYREHPSQHPHSHSQSQSGCSSPGDPCTYTSASGSSSSSPALGYARHTLAGGMGGGSSSAVLALAGSDLYYHQPYIRDSAGNANSASTEPCNCGCLTNPAAAHPLIALTHQLTQTVEMLRQLPEHAHHGQGQARCTILKSIGALHELMQCVSVPLSSSSSY